MVRDVSGESRRRAALAGLLAGFAALVVAALADAASGRVPSLVGVVGQAVIRRTPGSLARAGVEAVGRSDKPLVVAGTVILALLLAAVVGVAADRRRSVGYAAFPAFALLAVWAAAWTHAPVAGAAVAGALAAAAGIASLRLLLGPPAPEPEPETLLPGAGASRRRFLVAGSTIGAAAAAGLATGRVLRSGGGPPPPAALPATADPAPAPAGEPLAADGLSPLVTPTSRFFRIDEALVPPVVNEERWRLRITGMVATPLVLTYADLLAEPLVDRHITIACVSNEVGGNLVGTARWTGVRLADLLRRAGADPAATQVVGRSVDGFTAGFPTEAALDGRDALVAVGMGGRALTRIHGFPARLIVPGLYGYVSATKWLKEIELTTWEAFDAYWVERNWARQAPIKAQSRIDVPRDYSTVAAGRRAVAGVAWAPGPGVARVEVRVDEGPWQEAELGPSLGHDAWRQWKVGWDAAPGDHVLRVRATTGDGEVQTEATHRPFPDGATGYHRVHVAVSGQAGSS
ncbi:MAG TPA: molybdopterin-dependent oxidoreductase [Acidimicrobiales bacterium]|nr:molybdopterin-dependent oxidoreductase [Acidimicrobiales bacterium]